MAKKKSYRLYVYPSQEAMITSRGLEQNLQQRGKPQKGGGYLLEFPELILRNNWREDLLGADILCDLKPIDKRRQVLWHQFMTEEEKGTSFSIVSFLLGPLWYLGRGLLLKFFLLMGAYLGIQAAGAAAVEFGLMALPRFFTHAFQLGGLEISVGWGPLGHLAVALYAGMYAENDLFLSRIRHQHLWSTISGAGFGFLTVIFMVICYIGWAFTHVSMPRVLRQPSPMGAGLTFEFNDPLWRVAADARKIGTETVIEQSEDDYWETSLVLFRRGRLEEALGVVGTWAATGDKVALYNLGRMNIAAAGVHSEEGDEAAAVADMRRAIDALKAASDQGHEDAKRMLYELTKDASARPTR
ncbi:hypothetical protein ACFL2T_05530 [Elusimicrobiota bacterium]